MNGKVTSVPCFTLFYARKKKVDKTNKNMYSYYKSHLVKLRMLFVMGLLINCIQCSDMSDDMGNSLYEVTEFTKAEKITISEKHFSKTDEDGCSAIELEIFESKLFCSEAKPSEMNLRSSVLAVLFYQKLDTNDKEGFQQLNVNTINIHKENKYNYSFKELKGLLLKVDKVREFINLYNRQDFAKNSLYVSDSLINKRVGDETFEDRLGQMYVDYGELKGLTFLGYEIDGEFTKLHFEMVTIKGKIKSIFKVNTADKIRSFSIELIEEVVFQTSWSSKSKG